MRNFEPNLVTNLPSICGGTGETEASKSIYIRCDSDDIEIVKNRTPSEFIPLEFETRAAINTAAAARHLNRQPQTLRVWACHDDGPIRPLRIKGRLAWPVSELRLILGCRPLVNPINN